MTARQVSKESSTAFMAPGTQEEGLPRDLGSREQRPAFADSRTGRAVSPEGPLGSIPACRLLRRTTTERGLPVDCRQPRFSPARGILDRTSTPRQDT